VLIGNLAFRLIGAMAALAVVDEAASLLARIGDPARQLAIFHTGFNIVLALVFLPLTGRAADLLVRFVTQDKAPAADRRPEHLDDALLDRPAMALSGATREVMRLADTVELMLSEAIHPFEDRDDARREELRKLDSAVDRLQEEIKLYLTKLTRAPLSPEDSRRAFDLILFITNLEHVGDIIDKNLLLLAAKKQRLNLSFSPEGWGELRALHGLAVEQMRLAVTVFVTRDPDLARQLVEAKDQVRIIEKEATENHLRRLRDGAVASIETSSVHLDMLRDLKRIISHLTTVAHPILEETGELRGSRLRGRVVPAADAAEAARPAPGPV
jgi:phosphate:Na+ symporter